jgi:hypothetical protein
MPIKLADDPDFQGRVEGQPIEGVRTFTPPSSRGGNKPLTLPERIQRRRKGREAFRGMVGTFTQGDVEKLRIESEHQKFLEDLESGESLSSARGLSYKGREDALAALASRPATNPEYDESINAKEYKSLIDSKLALHHLKQRTGASDEEILKHAKALSSKGSKQGPEALDAATFFIGHDGLAKHVAKHGTESLSPEEHAQALNKITRGRDDIARTNPQAHQDYLDNRLKLYNLSPEDIEKARSTDSKLNAHINTHGVEPLSPQEHAEESAKLDNAISGVKLYVGRTKLTTKRVGTSTAIKKTDADFYSTPPKSDPSVIADIQGKNDAIRKEYTDTINSINNDPKLSAATDAWQSKYDSWKSGVDEHRSLYKSLTKATGKRSAKNVEITHPGARAAIGLADGQTTVTKGSPEHAKAIRYHKRNALLDQSSYDAAHNELLLQHPTYGLQIDAHTKMATQLSALRDSVDDKWDISSPTIRAQAAKAATKMEPWQMTPLRQQGKKGAGGGVGEGKNPKPIDNDVRPKVISLWAGRSSNVAGRAETEFARHPAPVSSQIHDLDSLKELVGTPNRAKMYFPADSDNAFRFRTLLRQEKKKVDTDPYFTRNPLYPTHLHDAGDAEILTDALDRAKSVSRSIMYHISNENLSDRDVAQLKEYHNNLTDVIRVNTEIGDSGQQLEPCNGHDYNPMTGKNDIPCRELKTISGTCIRHGIADDKMRELVGVHNQTDYSSVEHATRSMANHNAEANKLNNHLEKVKASLGAVAQQSSGNPSAIVTVPHPSSGVPIRGVAGDIHRELTRHHDEVSDAIDDHLSKVNHASTWIDVQNYRVPTTPDVKTEEVSPLAGMKPAPEPPASPTPAEEVSNAEAFIKDPNVPTPRGTTVKYSGVGESPRVGINPLESPSRGKSSSQSAAEAEAQASLPAPSRSGYAGDYTVQGGRVRPRQWEKISPTVSSTGAGEAAEQLGQSFRVVNGRRVPAGGWRRNLLEPTESVGDVSVEEARAENAARPLVPPRRGVATIPSPEERSPSTPTAEQSAAQGRGVEHTGATGAAVTPGHASELTAYEGATRVTQRRSEPETVGGMAGNLSENEQVERNETLDREAITNKRSDAFAAGRGL